MIAANRFTTIRRRIKTFAVENVFMLPLYQLLRLIIDSP